MARGDDSDGGGEDNCAPKRRRLETSDDAGQPEKPPDRDTRQSHSPTRPAPAAKPTTSSPRPNTMPESLSPTKPSPAVGAGASPARASKSPTSPPRPPPPPPPPPQAHLPSPCSTPLIPAAAATDDDDDDDDDTDDGYETASLGASTTTSLSSSRIRHVFEHGRRYMSHPASFSSPAAAAAPSDDAADYPIPNDDREQDREDLKHVMMLRLLGGRLFLAPVAEVLRVVDAGTGTGAWAMDVGEAYPAATVRGVDLTPIQPSWTPPNVSFLVDDVEQHAWLDRGLDLAHFRFMSVVLRDVPLALARAHAALRPGGWVELHELSGVPLCDDGSMPADDALAALYALAGAAWARMGLDVELPRRLRPLLEAAGFVNVHVDVRKVPIGAWARDEALKEVGTYQAVAVDELMQAFAGRPFAVLGIPPEEGVVRVALARRALKNLRVHRYFEYYFWWAQKPDVEG
jgi:SAM-dependent methyltransferase